MTTYTRSTVVAFAALLAAWPVGAQVVVTVQWLYPIETLYVADLAQYAAGRQPDFLSINLLSAGTPKVVLEVSLTRESPDQSLIFKGSTDPFDLRETMLRLTNRDLSCDNCAYAIVHGDVSAEFEDILTQTGRFPAGTYVITVRVLSPPPMDPPMELGFGETSLSLVNPTRLELLTPGRLFGETPEIVTTRNPRFQWSTDAGLALAGSDYRIRVVPADGSASAEDAIQGFATWEERTTATMVVYPGAASAIPLEPGRTYAWQVVRELRTSTGTELLASPIYWFRMAAATDDAAGTGRRGSAADAGAAVQLNQLGQALGLGNRLDGFRPTGQIIVDGRPMAVERLEELLQALLAGEIAVQSVTVR